MHSRPAEVRIRISEDLVQRFAALTGDVSSLHLDDAFARRSAYRRPVAHGMLPLAFLPLLAPLQRAGRRCVIRAVSAKFAAPVFADDSVTLAVEAVREGEAGDVIEVSYRVVREGTDVAATQGTIAVGFEPAPEDVGGARQVTGRDAPVSLLSSPPAQRSARLDEIEPGQEDPPLDLRVTAGCVDALVALLEAGLAEAAPCPLSELEQRFDVPSVLGVLLFSTSVGVCLPGASATFLELSARVASPLEKDVSYRLHGRVAHRSKATTIVKKTLTITAAEGPDEPLVEGKVAALVNPPARRMPSVHELRDTALDLGLRDKVVLVTGASRGIGETIAKLFALSGSKVVVNYHRGADDAERVVEELAGVGAEAIAVRADVTSREEVQALVGSALGRYGTIDVLVNNAARDYRPIPFAQLGWDEIQKDVDVVAKGAFLCCKEVIPIMLERGGGRIVNVSSSATEVPPPDQLKYVMAKSALVGLTRSLAVELAPRGIQVNMVVPHFVETDFVAHVQEGFRKKIADEIPMKRLTSPVDVAQAVLFLASAYSGFTTGQKLMVTGGTAPLL